MWQGDCLKCCTQKAVYVWERRKRADATGIYARRAVVRFVARGPDDRGGGERFLAIGAAGRMVGAFARCAIAGATSHGTMSRRSVGPQRFALGGSTPGDQFPAPRHPGCAYGPRANFDSQHAHNRPRHFGSSALEDDPGANDMAFWEPRILHQHDCNVSRA